MSLFDKKMIKTLIDFKWPLVKEFLIKKLFVPYILYLATYIFYMNYVYYERYAHAWSIMLNYSTMALLVFFSLYFLLNELR